MSDLISKSALLEALKEEQNDGAIGMDFYAFDDIVNDQPTIEAVPVVHAEWTNTGNTELDNVYSAHKCSVCGYTICGNASRFCGGCGAYMRKGGAE